MRSVEEEVEGWRQLEGGCCNGEEEEEEGVESVHCRVFEGVLELVAEVLIYMYSRRFL